MPQWNEVSPALHWEKFYHDAELVEGQAQHLVCKSEHNSLCFLPFRLPPICPSLPKKKKSSPCNVECCWEAQCRAVMHVQHNCQGITAALYSYLLIMVLVKHLPATCGLYAFSKPGKQGMSKENAKVMKQDRALCFLLVGQPVSRRGQGARQSESSNGAAVTSPGGLHGMPLGVVHRGGVYISLYSLYPRPPMLNVSLHCRLAL